MKLSAVIHAIESFAPLSLQEKWDNSGLQIGLPDGDGEVTGVMICLDTTADIVAEAVERGCNLIVSHHPLIFKGFKHITGSTPQEAAAAAAIRAGVAVYSAHTSLDSTKNGISYYMACLLCSQAVDVIKPADVPFYSVEAMCPREIAGDVRLALLDQVSDCISTDGEKDFLDYPEEFDPKAGMILEQTPFTIIKVKVSSLQLPSVWEALAGVPYGNEMKVTVTPLKSKTQQYGLGVYASVGMPMTGASFVELMKRVFHTPCIKASAAYRPDAEIRTIAVCGGSAPDFISEVAANDVDAYVTADVRYHDFANAANLSTIIFDIGHFESEICAKDIFYSVITKNFANFAVYKSERETNPINYL